MNMKLALKFEVNIGTGKRIPARLQEIELIGQQ